MSPDGVRAVLRRRHRWVAAAVVVAVYALVYPVVVLGIALVFRDPVDWSGPAGPFIGTAIGTGLVSWWQSRRMGGSDRVQQFERAVTSGRLPEDADPAVWRPLLARERRRVRRLLVGALALTSAVLVLVLALFWSAEDRAVGLAVAGALLVGTAALWPLSRRQVRRLDRLADQLPGRQPDSVG